MFHILTTAQTTTPPVTVVSSGLSFMSSVTVGPSLIGFPVSVVPPPPLMPRGLGGVLGSVAVPQQQPPSSMPPLVYANYAMGSPQVSFFFRVEPPIICILYMFGVCSGVCFLLLGAKLDAIFTYGGSTLWGLHLGNPLEFYPWQAYVQPGDGHWSTPGMHRVAAPSATLGRVEPSATHSTVPQPIGGVYSLRGSIESHPIPPPSLHDGEGSSFSRFGAIR